MSAQVYACCRVPSDVCAEPSARKRLNIKRHRRHTVTYWRHENHRTVALRQNPRQNTGTESSTVAYTGGRLFCGSRHSPHQQASVRLHVNPCDSQEIWQQHAFGVEQMYDYIAQFSFAAICLFIPSVPVTHCLGLVAHSPRSAKLKYLLLYPVKGGRHHLIFQIISWV